MGIYLDRLHEQHREITAGVDAVLNRAAEENRDVSDDESQQVERDRARLAELATAIDHYTSLERDGARVAALRSQVPPAAPQQTRTDTPEPDAFDVAREFPTMGHYASVVHRAVVRREPDAIALLERATANQTTADNPGLIPVPILGPVISLLNTTRPFINACVNRPLPGQKFDRPKVNQHVAVDIQAAEKTLTASQNMKIDPLPVSASTFAGHLNISRQDIKWTTPNILNIVFEDFGAMYARRTCDFASDAFITSLTGAATPISVAGSDPGAAVRSALFAAAATLLGTAGVETLPDTLFVAPDVWGQLGGMVGPMGVVSFPSLSLTDTGGNPLGLRFVVDQHFPAGTMVMGVSSVLEWYEDVDGLMQVGEPDVLGQMVGYAGYGAFLNTVPEAFAEFTLDATPIP